MTVLAHGGISRCAGITDPGITTMTGSYVIAIAAAGLAVCIICCKVADTRCASMARGVTPEESLAPEASLNSKNLIRCRLWN